VVHAYAKAAKKRGATIIEHNRVLELIPKAGRRLEPGHATGGQ
jgi:hypothetical protein